MNSTDSALNFPSARDKRKTVDVRLQRMISRGKIESHSSPTTMKSIFGCAAIVITAVLFAPLFSDSRVFRWNKSCLHGDTVRAETRGMSAVPSLVLWAWERPEDLRFLDPMRVGVAFLAATVRVGPEGMSYRPRMQALQVARETRLVAVVRIDIFRLTNPCLTAFRLVRVVPVGPPSFFPRPIGK